MSSQKGRPFFMAQRCWPLATAVVKVIGALYKIRSTPSSANRASAISTPPTHIYSVLLLISTAGLPVAMSRMITPGQFSGPLQSGPPHLRRSQRYFFDLRYRRQRTDDGLLPPTGPISEPAGCLGRHRLFGALCAADLHHFHLPGLLPGTGQYGAYLRLSGYRSRCQASCRADGGSGAAAALYRLCLPGSRRCHSGCHCQLSDQRGLSFYRIPEALPTPASLQGQTLELSGNRQGRPCS